MKSAEGLSRDDLFRLRDKLVEDANVFKLVGDAKPLHRAHEAVGLCDFGGVAEGAAGFRLLCERKTRNFVFFKVPVKHAGGSKAEALRIARLCYLERGGGLKRLEELRDELIRAAARGDPTPQPHQEAGDPEEFAAATSARGDGAATSPEAPGTGSAGDAAAGGMLGSDIRQRILSGRHDAPAGHQAHQKVTLAANNNVPEARAVFKWTESRRSRCFQVSVRIANNSKEEALRIARLCFMLVMDYGMTKEQVEAERDAMLIKIGGWPRGAKVAKEPWRGEPLGKQSESTADEGP